MAVRNQSESLSAIAGIRIVNDDGPAATNGVGFYLVPDTIAEFNASGTFISPQGYKPIGPVSIACAILQAGTIVRLAARGW